MTSPWASGPASFCYCGSFLSSPETPSLLDSPVLSRPVLEMWMGEELRELRPDKDHTAVMEDRLTVSMLAAVFEHPFVCAKLLVDLISFTPQSKPRQQVLVFLLSILWWLRAQAPESTGLDSDADASTEQLGRAQQTAPLLVHPVPYRERG